MNRVAVLLDAAELAALIRAVELAKPAVRAAEKQRDVLARLRGAQSSARLLDDLERESKKSCAKLVIDSGGESQ